MVEDILIDAIALILSIIALIVAFYFSRGKYKISKNSLELQRYNTWLNEIKPLPRILISDGQIKIRDYNVKKNNVDIIKTKAGTIGVNIANSGEGSANFPQWMWRLNLKENIEQYWSELMDVEIYKEQTEDLGISRVNVKYPYLDGKSNVISLFDYSLVFKELNECEYVSSLEIWIKYYGEKNVEWRSYRFFKFKNGEFIAEKPTKIYKKNISQLKKKK